MSAQHSQDRPFRLYAEGASVTMPDDPTTPHLMWYRLGGETAVVVVLSQLVRLGERRGRHRCDCPPDPMGFDCIHAEHREALGMAR